MSAFFCFMYGHGQIIGTNETEVFFKYDDAGNQRYRGLDPNGRQASEPEKPKSLIATPQTTTSDEEFWNEIKIYPVPVRDILTIEWTDRVDALISHISLYEQNTVHWKFQQENFANLNKRIQINMQNYYMGVYVLSFQLNDGRVISKNITKF